MKLPPFELERWFIRHELTAPIDACASDVEAPSMAEVLALAAPDVQDEWEALSLSYTEARGHPRLRAAIAGLYPGLAPDDVVVFTGAQEAIFAWANATFEPGDHAVVVWPAYQSLHEIARTMGADITPIELRHEDGWALDLDAIRTALRPQTRSVVVNFPHNPTGAHPDRAVWADLVALCEEAGVELFSDEVYRWGEHAPAERLPAAVEASERAISLGVMSKTFAAPGLRVGWIACRDRAVLARIAAVRDYTTVCSSAPSELLAIAVLEALEATVERTRSIVEPNLALLDRWFERWADEMEWVRPRGAPIGYPRLTGGRDAAVFARELLDDQGVLLMPGAVYGDPGPHFRLGFGRRDLPQALERLDSFLESRR